MWQTEEFSGEEIPTPGERLEVLNVTNLLIQTCWGTVTPSETFKRGSDSETSHTFSKHIPSISVLWLNI